MKLAELLAEIKQNDAVYSKRGSHHVVSKQLVDSTWAPLMMVDGYEFVWKEVGPEYRVVMKDHDGSALLRLELKVKSISVPGGNLTGVITDSLSSHEKIRGTGMALKMYQAMVQHGQVLISSNAQTAGSRKLWERLVASEVGEVFVLAEEAAARWYCSKAGIDCPGKVLLTGPLDKLNDEAYASSETRWVIVPFDMVGDLKKSAINLSRVTESVEDDFLFGDCASFAAALQDKIGGELYALSRRGKALHVFVKHNGKNYDVRGERSTNAMARSLVGSIQDFEVHGPFTRDNQPCSAVKPKMVAKAAEYINKHKRLFEENT